MKMIWNYMKNDMKLFEKWYENDMKLYKIVWKSMFNRNM